MFEYNIHDFFGKKKKMKDARKFQNEGYKKISHYSTEDPPTRTGKWIYMQETSLYPGIDASAYMGNQTCTQQESLGMRTLAQKYIKRRP